MTVTTNLPSADNPPPSGRAFQFIATVASASPASGQPTGTVTWKVAGTGGPTLGCSAGPTVKLSKAGVAACRVSSGELIAAFGPYTATATYSGDSNFTTSSGPLSQTVDPAMTKTHLTGSPVPPLPGATVLFSASVTWVTPEAYAPSPTGTITFTFVTPSGAPAVVCQGGTTTVTLGSAGAVCTVSGGLTTAGAYKVTAAYNGDANDTASPSSHSLSFKVK